MPGDIHRSIGAGAVGRSNRSSILLGKEPTVSTAGLLTDPEQDTFPQGEPGKAESPGPVRNLPAERLRGVLGLTRVDYVEGRDALAVADATLG